VVVFLHGIASHGGWFAETAVDLDTQGVAVYAPDRRGSGRSGGPRGHLNRYERALDDVDEVVRRVSAEHPGTPLFLAASSWAAKLGVVYAARRPAPLSGLLLLGPGLLPRVSLSRTRQLVVVVGHLVAPTARLSIPLTPELYTTNPRYLEAIRADRLRLLKATTRFFWETGRLDRGRQDAAAGLEIPLLLLQGEDDAMMDVAGTRHWFSGLRVEDKTYRAYPGAGHTLDFEPDRSRYLADMVGWLSARAPSGSSRSTGGGP
jgi:alpha-beta hydrolase superfamily lysophospholipase